MMMMMMMMIYRYIPDATSLHPWHGTSLPPSKRVDWTRAWRDV